MSKLSVVLVGPKACRPFIREVFTAEPEPGYKFNLVIEKSCTAPSDPLWKLVFDLYHADANGAFQQVVHISFTPDEAEETRGVEALTTEPIKPETARLLHIEVHPCAKEVAGSANPTPGQAAKLEESMSRVARSGLARETL